MKDCRRFWVEITPEMLTQLKARGMLADVPDNVVRLPRLNFAVSAGRPGDLDYNISRGRADPNDYWEGRK